jgi:hypothetical protein
MPDGGQLQGQRRRRRRRGEGQSLVEFALVIPIFLLLMLSIVEFAFVFNAILQTNFASRNAALIAAEAGSSLGADCVILLNVENDFGAPADRTRITSVQVYWSDQNGVQIGSNVTTYNRTGSFNCPLPDGTTIALPYTQAGNGYPEAARCNLLAGCGGTHTGLDMIGVRIGYSHIWKTPLDNFINQGGGGFIFDRSNAMRMEPIL